MRNKSIKSVRVKIFRCNLFCNRYIFLSNCNLITGFISVTVTDSSYFKWHNSVKWSFTPQHWLYSVCWKHSLFVCFCSSSGVWGADGFRAWRRVTWLVFKHIPDAPLMNGFPRDQSYRNTLGPLKHTDPSRHPPLIDCLS